VADIFSATLPKSELHFAFLIFKGAFCAFEPLRQRGVQAVYGFHVAARHYPYHFGEWLRDCPGYKVYLILADFAGREYNALV
jgi:hypothetical protein